MVSDDYSNIRYHDSSNLSSIKYKEKEEPEHLTAGRNPVKMGHLNWIKLIRSRIRPLLFIAAKATRTAGSNAECRCDAVATSGCLID
jgi:hypothetical protein